MRRASVIVLSTSLAMLATFAIGCRRPHATQPTAPRPSARATHPTQYRPGEFVAYGFTGKAVSRPTIVREEIVDQSPEGIVLDVVIQREPESTPEDRRHFRKTVGANTVDLYRFTAWSLLVPDSPPDEDDKKKSEIVDVGGRKLRCEITNGSMKVRGRKVRYATSACPDFLWTHGPARYWDPETNETLLSIEIAETGHETLCDYEMPSCPTAEACAFVERDRAACVAIGVLDTPLGSPFRAAQRFACTQRARSDAGRTHSFVGDLFAVDLASARDAKSVEIIAPVSGEASVFDGCDAERADAPEARNDSRCGLGYGNHVKIWDGTNLVMLAHLSQVRVKNGPVKRGDLLGIEGVSGSAGQRHVHVTVTRLRPDDDVHKILASPGWKGQVPVRWKLDVVPQATWVDELSCDEGLAHVYSGH